MVELGLHLHQAGLLLRKLLLLLLLVWVDRLDGRVLLVGVDDGLVQLLVPHMMRRLVHG